MRLQAVQVVAQSSCYRLWWRIFEELGTVKKPPSPLICRTWIIISSYELSWQLSRTSSLRTLISSLTKFAHGLPASTTLLIIGTSTLCHNLKQADLTRRLLQKLASGHDEARREDAFAILSSSNWFALSCRCSAWIGGNLIMNFFGIAFFPFRHQ